jgi:hypothetical protein
MVTKGKPYKEEKDKKVKYGISIDRYLFERMKKEEVSISKFIQRLVKEYYSTTKNKKTYRLTNQEQNVIVTNNLREFCNKNNLVYSTMSNLSRGIGKTNKGWKCEVIKN